jgi:hypothetical protein
MNSRCSSRSVFRLAWGLGVVGVSDFVRSLSGDAWGAEPFVTPDSDFLDVVLDFLGLLPVSQPNKDIYSFKWFPKPTPMQFVHCHCRPSGQLFADAEFGEYHPEQVV